MKGDQLTMDELLDLPRDEDLGPSDYESVLAFHRKFDLPRPATPRLLDADTFRFRYNFLLEELDEFYAAHRERRLVDAFDGLLDLAYVTIGTAIFMGLPWQHGFDEVQRANLSKVRAATAAASKRRHATDVVKPEGWIPPQLEAVLRDHWYRVKLHEEEG